MPDLSEMVFQDPQTEATPKKETKAYTLYLVCSTGGGVPPHVSGWLRLGDSGSRLGFSTRPVRGWNFAGSASFAGLVGLVPGCSPRASPVGWVSRSEGSGDIQKATQVPKRLTIEKHIHFFSFTHVLLLV